MMRLYLRLVSAAVLFKFATGSIYGTSPISSTTFRAGRMNTVSWIEDGESPLIQEMGPVKIDLYVGAEVCPCVLQQKPWGVARVMSAKQIDRLSFCRRLASVSKLPFLVVERCIVVN